MLCFHPLDTHAFTLRADVLLSAGDDGMVKRLDVREALPTRASWAAHDHACSRLNLGGCTDWCSTSCWQLVEDSVEDLVSVWSRVRQSGVTGAVHV